jgi:ABC-type Fe3+/spermidine/putrescine transport system ATPase subunit
MLALHNITVDYVGQPIFTDLSLTVATKEIVSLVGPSGSGKTTLLRVIAGLEKPRTGSIVIDGTDISLLPTHQRGIGLVFQDNQLFPHLTVEQNIAYPQVLRNLALYANWVVLENPERAWRPYTFNNEIFVDNKTISW